MRILNKKLRIASFIMSFLVLFVSCNRFDNELTDNQLNLNKTSVIKQYVEKQIELSKKLFELIEKENITNLNSLNDVKDYDYKNLKKTLKNVNIKEFNAISDLLKEIDDTNLNFIENNLDLKKYDKTFLDNLLITEIDKQLEDINDNQYLRRMGPCEQARHTSFLRCSRNFTIGVAASATSGLLSFGIGALIGATSTLILFTLCMTDAHSDYDNCVSNQSQ